MTAALRIHADDDVAVVLDEVASGATVELLDGPTLVVRGPVPRGTRSRCATCPPERSSASTAP